VDKLSLGCTGRDVNWTRHVGTIVKTDDENETLTRQIIKGPNWTVPTYS